MFLPRLLPFSPFIPPSRRRDVLLLLYADDGCDACVALVPYYNRVAGRLRELGVSSVAVSASSSGGK